MITANKAKEIANSMVLPIEVDRVLNRVNIKITEAAFKGEFSLDSALDLEIDDVNVSDMSEDILRMILENLHKRGYKTIGIDPKKIKIFWS